MGPTGRPGRRREVSGGSGQRRLDTSDLLGLRVKEDVSGPEGPGSATGVEPEEEEREGGDQFPRLPVQEVVERQLQSDVLREVEDLVVPLVCRVPRTTALPERETVETKKGPTVGPEERALTPPPVPEPTVTVPVHHPEGTHTGRREDGDTYISYAVRHPTEDAPTFALLPEGFPGWPPRSTPPLVRERDGVDYLGSIVDPDVDLPVPVGRGDSGFSQVLEVPQVFQYLHAPTTSSTPHESPAAG